MNLNELKSISESEKIENVVKRKYIKPDGIYRINTLWQSCVVCNTARVHDIMSDNKIVCQLCKQETPRLKS